MSGADTFDVAIVGAGYVGVPLAQTFADAGRRVLLIEINPRVVESLKDRKSTRLNS